MLLFEEKVSQNRTAFIERVKQLAKTFNANPNWFMALFNSETGGSFKSDIYNMGGSGAVGLIQFMPRTAQDLGATTSFLASLSNVEQLDWVEKYLHRQLANIGRTAIKDYDDLYLLVFYPVAVGKPDSYTIPLSGLGYSQNSGIDMNGDGIITVADFKAFIRSKIPASNLSEFTARFRYGKQLFFGFVSIGIITVIYFYYNSKKVIF
jgi:hypothetical protein